MTEVCVCVWLLSAFPIRLTAATMRRGEVGCLSTPLYQQKNRLCRWKLGVITVGSPNRSQSQSVSQSYFRGEVGPEAHVVVCPLPPSIRGHDDGQSSARRRGFNVLPRLEWFLVSPLTKGLATFSRGPRESHWNAVLFDNVNVIKTDPGYNGHVLFHGIEATGACALRPRARSTGGACSALGRIHCPATGQSPDDLAVIIIRSARSS